MFDNILALTGLIGSAYSFSNGIPLIGLIFVIVIITSLLMKPPKTEVEP